MKIELKQEELTSINGGAFKYGIIGAFVIAGTFIIGIVDGFLRPYPCRK